MAITSSLLCTQTSPLHHSVDKKTQFYPSINAHWFLFTTVWNSTAKHRQYSQQCETTLRNTDNIHNSVKQHCETQTIFTTVWNSTAKHRQYSQQCETALRNTDNIHNSVKQHCETQTIFNINVDSQWYLCITENKHWSQYCKDFSALLNVPLTVISFPNCPCLTVWLIQIV